MIVFQSHHAAINILMERSHFYKIKHIDALLYYIKWQWMKVPSSSHRQPDWIKKYPEASMKHTYGSVCEVVSRENFLGEGKPTGNVDDTAL